MKTRTIREQLIVLEWDNATSPEMIMGYIEIERRFQVFKDGHERLDESFQERITAIDDLPVSYNWSRTTLDEFFPGWKSIEKI